MKFLIMALIFLVLSLPAAGAETRGAVQDGGRVDLSELRQTLHAVGTMAEGYFQQVLDRLKAIAATDEAGSGDWERMRPLLAEIEKSGVKTAAVWFVRPDGSYYSVEQGLTGQNLRDRSYFPGLMAGGEVPGELVLSKSTGKRSAVIAVPVWNRGRIIGALGTSVDLEEVSRMLEEELNLPANMLFYAIDRHGRTSLHRKTALLFGYPSDMGSRSLAESVRRMLAEPAGVVTYDFYGERTVAFKRFPLTGWVYAVGIATGRPGQPVAELPPILAALAGEIDAGLDRMDRDTARVAARFSRAELQEAQRRKLLRDLCRSFLHAVDCSFVDRRGRMVLVEPHGYGQFEGSDISSQDQVIRLHQTGEPVLSNAFRAVEGFEAVDLEHPVFSPDGELAGSVSLLFRPETLFAGIIRPMLQGMPVEAFIMQPDGRILYDEDEEEVGRMLFADPIYQPFPQLLALGSLMAKETAGAGSYDFKQRGAERLVKKDAHWTTVGLHGTQWRLVVMYLRPGQGHLSPD